MSVRFTRPVYVVASAAAKCLSSAQLCYQIVLHCIQDLLAILSISKHDVCCILRRRACCPGGECPFFSCERKSTEVLVIRFFVMMKEHVQRLLHAQNGYSKINLEDGVLSSQGPSLAINSNSFYTRWKESVWRCISVSMFLSGILMLIISRQRKPSDRECTAQLSIWCEINRSFSLIIHFLKNTADENFVLAPLIEAVEYEQRDWTSGLSASEFSGPPTPELEARWSEISTCKSS